MPNGHEVVEQMITGRLGIGPATLTFAVHLATWADARERSHSQSR